MPGFGLLASGLVLSALALWFQLQSDKLKSQSDKLKSQSKNVDGNKDKSEKKDKVTQSEREKKDKDSDKETESKAEEKDDGVALLPFVHPPDVFRFVISITHQHFEYLG
jgi:hypothetical protein